jgi:hypothetical protein
MSREWEAASRVPLDWMIYDTLKGDAEHYLEDRTGYGMRRTAARFGRPRRRRPRFPFR